MKINPEYKADVMKKLIQIFIVWNGYSEIHMIKCIKLYEMNLSLKIY